MFHFFVGSDLGAIWPGYTAVRMEVVSALREIVLPEGLAQRVLPQRTSVALEQANVGEKAQS